MIESFCWNKLAIDKLPEEKSYKFINMYMNLEVSQMWDSEKNQTVKA